jgi:oligopeptide/dipeptide ABC transporter ATP-binding protein
MTESLLELDDLSIKYRVDDGSISAVTDASFTVEQGRYHGLVGESGCGKSTIAKALLGGLDANGEITSGVVRYRGEEIQDMTQQELNKKIRWDEIALIPQSAMNSLDPIQKISTQAIELADVHTGMPADEARDRLRELFDIVGLQPSRIEDYPFEFSGGMQQRAIIAFALLLEPSLLIADEPTTALDVIMQDQVFAYLDRVREEIDTSMLLITHDISVVLESCDDLTVMHAGQIAETGSVIDVYESPLHPYFILLKDAFPDIQHPNQTLSIIEGDPPQLRGEVDYCTFVDRCPWATDECRQGMPALESIEGQSADHKASCIRKDESLNQQYTENRMEYITGDADD